MHWERWCGTLLMVPYHLTPASASAPIISNDLNLSFSVTCILILLAHFLKYSSLQVPEKILVWSVHVLTAILTIVKPVYLYDVHCIQELYKKISEGYSTSFPAKVCYILHVYIEKIVLVCLNFMCLSISSLLCCC